MGVYECVMEWRGGMGVCMTVWWNGGECVNIYT